MLSLLTSTELYNHNSSTAENIVPQKEELLPEWFDEMYFVLRLLQGFVSFSG